MRSLILVSLFSLALPVVEHAQAAPACPAMAKGTAPACSAAAKAVAPSAAPGTAPVAAGKSNGTVAATKVAKVVFVDKEEACACSRKRIDATWAALQAALGTPATVPVERLHADTQSAQAELYTTLKPLMVPPGVYFLDEKGAILDLLQGEVTAEEIAAVLKKA